MRRWSKSPIWFGILVLFVGLACNPLGSLVSQTVETPPVTASAGIGVSMLPTPTERPPLPVQPTRPPLVSPATSPATSPTASPVPSATAAERSVRVDALFVTGGSPASGGTNGVEIRVRPASSPGQLRVGFLEQEVGGTGSQWHAAGWEAVLIASMLTGVDPTNYEFIFSVGGRIDGPSAGGLMTVGVLAALRGDTPRADATMTGTINPDGTIGPVGGIPHKVEGAANKGKKLVLVPLGQRFNQDLNTKKMVDVVSEGSGLGIEVREVGNVYDAYQQIVGKTLARPNVTARAPQLPTRAFDHLRVRLGAWYTRYDHERTLFNSFSSSIRQYLADDVKAADKWATKSIQDLNQGLVGLAYFEITDAVSRMRATNVDGRIVERYNASGLNGAVTYLESVATVESDLNSAIEQMQLQEPKTVSDIVGLFDTYSYLGGAEGTILGVEDRLGTLRGNLSKYSKDQVLVELMNIGDDMITASNYVDMAADAVDFEMGLGSTPAPTAAKVQAVADTLSRAGDANLAMFESTTIADIAKELSITNDDAKYSLLQKDSDYRVAVLSGKGERELWPKMHSKLHAQAMIFGNAQNIFAYTSGLVAKYYSLDAQLDKNFQVTSFGSSKALSEMLDFADQRVKELTALCGDDVPIPAIIYYENARSLRQGSPRDQLTALNYYWQAVALAQADAFLSGKLSLK